MPLLKSLKLCYKTLSMLRQKKSPRNRNFQSLPQKTSLTPKVRSWFMPFLLAIFIFIKIGDVLRFVFSLPLKIFKTLPHFPKMRLKIPNVKKTWIKLSRKIVLKRFPHFTIKPIINILKKFHKPPKIKPTIIMFAPYSAWPIKIKWFFLGALFIILFILFPYIFYSWINTLPHPGQLALRDVPTTTKIFDRNGNLLYQIFANQNRTPIKLSSVPESLKIATIAIEDRDFYHHKGYDVRAILRAAKETFINKKVQGGSTITQQLIKNALLTPDVSIKRKIKEIILAFWAEKIYTKDQILEMYFNQVPYGGTAWGVETAAETYFGKTVLELNLAESALLAGLPAAPSTYSPFGSHPELTKTRQAEVLRRMTEDGYITSQQAEEAKNTSLIFAKPVTEIKAPHFVLYVKDLLVKRYGSRIVEQGGLRVETTLDLSTQEKAQEIVSNEIEKLDSLHVGNGAVLVVNPKTGEIMAMVGSRNYFDITRDGNVNVTLALRQPGSAIKPVNYAAAFEKGFTAATILDDSPVVYSTAGQPPYAPVNYDGKFHGRMLLRYAFANSYNVPAVKTLAAIGIPSMIEIGKRMGITAWDETNRFGLSLTLGGGEVTMLDITKAYGTLANSGKKVELNPILKVTDYKGTVLQDFTKPNENQAISPEIAFILSDILADNNARTNAFGPNSQLVIKDHTVSVKTGTTNDKRDNWTIGYTPSILTAVWVGNNDNSPMNQELTSGVTGAAPIWNKIMTELLKSKPDEKIVKPEGVIAVQICSVNGLLPCKECPTKTEYFIKGTEPRTACTKIAPSPTPRVIDTSDGGPGPERS